MSSDSESKRVEKAIFAAIGLQSSMNELNNFFTEAPDLRVAIGIDVGKTIATKLGHRGDKEKIILGKAVVESEKMQQKHAKGAEIFISKKDYDKLENQLLKKYFKETEDGFYSAKNLTHDKLDEEYKKSTNADNRTSIIENGAAFVGLTASSTQKHIHTPVHCWGVLNEF